jgi:uncharacterized membrane protein YqjE
MNRTSTTTSGDGEPPAILALIKDLVDGLGTLLTSHIRLARVELAGELGRQGRRLGLVACAGALLFVGYAFSCVAGAVALAPFVGLPLAFLAVGGVNLLAAGIALPRILAPAPTGLLDESVSELRRTVVALAQVGDEARPLAEKPHDGRLERIESRGIA